MWINQRLFSPKLSTINHTIKFNTRKAEQGTSAPSQHSLEKLLAAPMRTDSSCNRVTWSDLCFSIRKVFQRSLINLFSLIYQDSQTFSEISRTDETLKVFLEVCITVRRRIIYLPLFVVFLDAHNFSSQKTLHDSSCFPAVPQSPTAQHSWQTPLFMQGFWAPLWDSVYGLPGIPWGAPGCLLLPGKVSCKKLRPPGNSHNGRSPKASTASGW